MERTCEMVLDNHSLAIARNLTVKSAALLTVVNRRKNKETKVNRLCHCTVCTDQFTKAVERYEEIYEPRTVV